MESFFLLQLQYNIDILINNISKKYKINLNDLQSFISDKESDIQHKIKNNTIKYALNNIFIDKLNNK